MCPLLRGVAMALVFLMAVTPNPSCGQAVVPNSPLCLQGQVPYTTGQVPYTTGQVPYTTGQNPYTTGQVPNTMGFWPCYLYYVNYPFVDQVHVDQVTQTVEEPQSQENVTSVQTELENNTTGLTGPAEGQVDAVTVVQENTTSVETKPEDNTTCPLEVVADLQHQLEDLARQQDFQQNQLQTLTLVMEEALHLLLEAHGDHTQHVEDHARPWKSEYNQLQILAAAMGKALNTLYQTQKENDAQTGVTQHEVDELQEQMQSVQQAVLLLAAKLGHRAAPPAVPSRTHFSHEHLEHVEDHAHPVEHHENQLQILTAAMGEVLRMLHEIQEENDAQTDLLQQQADQQQEQMQSPMPEPAANPTMSNTTQVNQENNAQTDLLQQQADQQQEQTQSPKPEPAANPTMSNAAQVNQENGVQTDLLQQQADQQQEQTQSPKPEPAANPTMSNAAQVNQDDEQLEEKVEQQAIQLQRQERELGQLKFHQQHQDAQILILLQAMFEIAEENKRLEEQVEQQAMQMQNQIKQMTQQRDLLHHLQHEVRSLRDTVNDRTQAVAFSVRFSGWTIVNVGAGGGYGDTLMYNETITNIGDGYDPSSGLFIAPCAGLYAFFFSHHSSVYGWVTLGIFHGDRNIALSTVYGKGESYDKGSGFGTVHLTKGEIVNVRLMGTSKERSLSYMEVGPFTTFSGMLVSAY